MTILLLVLAWVFLGLLAVGINRRVGDYYVRRVDVLIIISLAPISILLAIFSYFGSSPFWNKIV